MGGRRDGWGRTREMQQRQQWSELGLQILPPMGKLSLGKSNVSLDNARKREGGSQYYRHSALKMHLLGMPFFMKGSLSSGKFEEWVSDYQFQISRCWDPDSNWSTKFYLFLWLLCIRVQVGLEGGEERWRSSWSELRARERQRQEQKNPGRHFENLILEITNCPRNTKLIDNWNGLFRHQHYCNIEKAW